MNFCKIKSKNGLTLKSKYADGMKCCENTIVCNMIPTDATKQLVSHSSFL